MTKVEEREKIRRAYFLENKSVREIARELHHSRDTVSRRSDQRRRKDTVRELQGKHRC